MGNDLWTPVLFACITCTMINVCLKQFLSNRTLVTLNVIAFALFGALYAFG